MSKSKGNVVNPDDFTLTYGADVFRLYLMFMGPYELGGDWSDKGISGSDRFVQRSYELFNKYKDILSGASDKDIYDIPSLSAEEKSVYKKLNHTIKKFDEEINNFRFNTAIASLMELINELKNLDNCSKDIQAFTLKRFAVLLGPVAPHLAEECWQIIGNKKTLFENPVWYNYDSAALIQENVNIAVQVNGKLRSTQEVPAGSSQAIVKEIVFNDDKIIKHLDGKTVIKEIFVPNKIYNIVVK
jgi:leucyl-tRNA synthetase